MESSRWEFFTSKLALFAPSCSAESYFASWSYWTCRKLTLEGVTWSLWGRTRLSCWNEGAASPCTLCPDGLLKKETIPNSGSSHTDLSSSRCLLCLVMLISWIRWPKRAIGEAEPVGYRDFGKTFASSAQRCSHVLCMGLISWCTPPNCRYFIQFPGKSWFLLLIFLLKKQPVARFLFSFACDLVRLWVHSQCVKRGGRRTAKGSKRLEDVLKHNSSKKLPLPCLSPVPVYLSGYWWKSCTHRNCRQQKAVSLKPSDF